MKNHYLTLRVSQELGRAIARWARERGVSRSLVVREAVTNYLVPTAPGTEPRTVTAADLALQWPHLAGLTPEEARDFASELDTARHELPPAAARWE